MGSFAIIFVNVSCYRCRASYVRRGSGTAYVTARCPGERDPVGRRSRRRCSASATPSTRTSRSATTRAAWGRRAGRRRRSWQPSSMTRRRRRATGVACTDWSPSRPRSCISCSCPTRPTSTTATARRSATKRIRYDTLPCAKYGAFVNTAQPISTTNTKGPCYWRRRNDI